MLLCHSHCDLDLYPIEHKINREHPLSITNVCMKFEKAGPNQILDIDRTRLYTMNGPMDKQVQSSLPLFFEGGIVTKRQNFRLVQILGICRQQSKGGQKHESCTSLFIKTIKFWTPPI